MAAVLFPLGPDEAHTFSCDIEFKFELELLRLTETLQLCFSMLWFFIRVTITFLGRKLWLWPLLRNTGSYDPASFVLSIGWGNTFYIPLVAPIANLNGFPLDTYPLCP